jgi:nucleoid DNA-binding protein
MNKDDIIRAVYEKLDKKLPMTKIEKCLDGILDVMSDGLKEGEEIQLSDFGTFSLASKSIRPVIKSVKKKK